MKGLPAPLLIGAALGIIAGQPGEERFTKHEPPPVLTPGVDHDKLKERAEVKCSARRVRRNLRRLRNHNRSEWGKTTPEWQKQNARK